MRVWGAGGLGAGGLGDEGLGSWSGPWRCRGTLAWLLVRKLQLQLSGFHPTKHMRSHTTPPLPPHPTRQPQPQPQRPHHPTQELNEDELVRVLTEPRNALCKQYSQLFRLSGARFVATSAGVRAIARRALDRGTGTRSLRSIMEQLLQGAMYEVADGGEAEAGAGPRVTVVLDEEGVVKGTGARLIEGGSDEELRDAVGEEEVVECLAAEVR